MLSIIFMKGESVSEVSELYFLTHEWCADPCQWQIWRNHWYCRQHILLFIKMSSVRLSSLNINCCEKGYFCSPQQTECGQKCVITCVSLVDLEMAQLFCFVFGVVLWNLRAQGWGDIRGGGSPDWTGFCLCLQAKVNNLSSAVLVIRVMRDLCNRVPTWTPLSGWVRKLFFHLWPF